MTHVIEDDDLWSKNEYGVGRESPGMELFRQRTASLLASKSYSMLFRSSRVDEDGNISEGTLGLKEGQETLISVPNYEGVIIVKDDRIINVYNEDGSINDKTLGLCFAKLDLTPVVTITDSSKTSLHEKFHATNGRDRLLDFMARKTKAANEPQYEKWRQEARENLRKSLKSDPHKQEGVAQAASNNVAARQTLE